MPGSPECSRTAGSSGLPDRGGSVVVRPPRGRAASSSTPCPARSPWTSSRASRPTWRAKILVDVANAVETDAQGFATASRHPGGSLAEEIQRALPAVRVVKTLNTLHASVMAAPRTLATPPSAFLSGDDTGARKTVAALLTDLGWPPEWIVDLGDIRTARAPEAFLLLVGSLVRAWGPVPFAMSVAR